MAETKVVLCLPVGEGEQADQGSTCRPEPGVSALSSEGLNPVHREECVSNLPPYLRV